MMEFGEKSILTLSKECKAEWHWNECECGVRFTDYLKPFKCLCGRLH